MTYFPQEPFFQESTNDSSLSLKTLVCRLNPVVLLSDLQGSDGMVSAALRE